MQEQFLGTRFHYNRMFRPQTVRLARFEVLQIGEICVEAGFEVPRHEQYCSEISFIVSGSGVFEQDGARLAVKAGDIVLSPADGTHVIRAAGQEALFYAFAGFRFLREEEFPSQVKECFARGQRAGKDICGMYGHFRRCMEEFDDAANIDPLMAEACLMQLVLWSCRCVGGDSRSARGEQLYENPGPLVYRALKYVEQHIEQPLTVAQLAAQLGYSPAHVSHEFRRKMGITLQEHIGARKAERAKELIALGRFSMTEIAAQLGYANLQSFSRAFCRQAGVSPSAYRQSLE